MGNATSSSVTRGAAATLPETYLADLGHDVQYEKSLGSSRFLKTIRARHRHGLLVVKVFVKPDPSMNLLAMARKLNAEHESLIDCPNILTYTRSLAMEKAGYLLRQWVASSLYDRISTRPFLSLIEKKWIAFQLLRALADAVDRKVQHGDIKSENVLITSWNWVYLSDFSSFKPTYLPEDDPSEVLFFFDTSGRRTCYLAPERFYHADSEIAKRRQRLQQVVDEPLTEAMDVFSLGCVIAELFLEGMPLFTLSQLFKYRDGSYSPESTLASIEDAGIREMIRTMTSLHPENRGACQQHLSAARDAIFPESFYSFLHPFIANVNDIGSTWSHPLMAKPPSALGHTLAEATSSVPTRTDADEIIQRIWTEFDSMRVHFGDTADHITAHQHLINETIFPIHLHIPEMDSDVMPRSAEEEKSSATAEDGAILIILTLLCANIRNCLRPTSVIRALDLFLAMAKYLSDETKLDRLLPYIVVQLQSEAAIVRAAAVRTLSQILMLVKVITPSNATVFTEYILPNVKPLTSDPDESVRCMYAQCLATLAESGRRYLEMTQALKAEGTFNLVQTQDYDSSPLEASYDASMNELRLAIQEQTTLLLQDPSSSVRRAMLRDVSVICVFLGRSITNDVLSHVLTYLNDLDWQLRHAFFTSAVGLASSLGSKSVEAYILPLISQAVSDYEEAVSARVLSSLATLTQLATLNKAKIWESLVGGILGLLCHPNIWIRQATAAFIAASAEQLSPTDVFCILYPTLRRYLKGDIKEVTQTDVLRAALLPLPRNIYEAILTWAERSKSTSIYWKQQQQKSREMARLTKDDEAQLDKLRQLGLSRADEMKLNDLRAILMRLAESRASHRYFIKPQAISGEEVTLQAIGVVPSTIILSRKTEDPSKLQPPMRSNSRRVSAESAKSTRGTSDDLRRRLQGNNSSSSVATPTSPSLSSTPSSTRLADEFRSASLFKSPTAIYPSRAEPNSRHRSKFSSSGVEIQKVTPAIAPDLTNATGQFNVEQKMAEDDAASGISTAIPGGTRRASSRFGGLHSESPRFTSTYEGDYASIQQLVDQMYLDNSREDVPEFGPRIPNKVPAKRRVTSSSLQTREKPTNRPEGFLVARQTEHTGAINSIAVAPDHLFFATASNDGTVKVWDALRLEKNVTSRSRQTIQQGGRVKAVCMLENSHCFASCSDNGTIMVHRVDFSQHGTLYKYAKPLNVRSFALEDDGDFGNCLLHYDTDASSNLVIGTHKSAILYLDLRNMRITMRLQLPLHLGSVTALCIDRKHNWILAGTSNGYLTLWDLRFKLMVRSWNVSASSSSTCHAIRQLTIHKTRGKGLCVIVAYENSTGLEVWDIERDEMVEVFEVGLVDSTATTRTGQTKEAELDSAKSIELMLQQRNLARSEQPSTKKSAVLAFLHGVDYAMPSHTGSVDLTQRTLSPLKESLSLSGELVDSASSQPSNSPNSGGYFITGGEDRKLRFLSGVDITKSTIFNGNEIDDEKVVFKTTQQSSPVIHSEKRSAAPGPTGATKRMMLISNHQQALLRTHQDAVTAMAFLELPFRCIITGDRAGVLHVYE